MIVTLDADGAVVQDADDCTRLHLATALDGDALRRALRDTGAGEVAPDGTVWLDLAVLRSRAKLAATAPDWAQRWDAMLAHAAEWVSVDGAVGAGARHPLGCGAVPNLDRSAR